VDLNDVPCPIFDESSKQHFYDQIAWFQENGNRSVLSLRFLSAGSFDFVPLLQGVLTKTQLSWKISDRTTTRSGLSSAFRCRPPRITAAARHASSAAVRALLLAVRARKPFLAGLPEG
jgi:hypothetical protein